MKAIKVIKKETRRVELIMVNSIVSITKENVSSLNKSSIYIYLINGKSEIYVDSDKVDAIYDMIENFIIYGNKGTLDITI